MSSLERTDDPRPPEKTTTDRGRLPVIDRQYTPKLCVVNLVERVDRGQPVMRVHPVDAGVAAAADEHDRHEPAHDAEHEAEMRRFLEREHQKYPRCASQISLSPACSAAGLRRRSSDGIVRIVIERSERPVIRTVLWK